MECEDFEEYRAVIKLITGEPCLVPTEQESLALAREIGRIRLAQPMSERARERSAVEMFGLTLASVAAFLIISTVVALQAFGRINLLPEANPLVFAKIGLIALVFMMITSFVPIFVTARRRPLNGLTFRR